MKYIPLQKSIIFGPVKSRRLKRSLGINLMPINYKLCSFNCMYCYFGRTDILTNNLYPYVKDLPTPIEVEHSLERKLLQYKSKNRIIDYITLTGNGEDSLHPQFCEIIERIIKTRDNIFPEIPIAIFSNSSTALRSEIREALLKIDFRFMKLDAPNSQLFQKINMPYKKISFERVVEGLKQMNNKVIIQSAFILNKISNFKVDYLKEWIELLKEIKPSSIQIYRTCYPTSEISLINPNLDSLNRVKKTIKNQFDIEVFIY